MGEFTGNSHQRPSIFIAGHTGAKVAEGNPTDETILTAAFDLDEIREYRD